MKFLADESVDFRIITRLEQHGYSVYSVGKNKGGISDEEVLKLSVERGEILLTEDKDFGELSIRFNLPNSGIILLRANDKTVDERLEMLLHVLKEHGKALETSLVVIRGTDNIRFRRLK